MFLVVFLAKEANASLQKYDGIFSNGKCLSTRQFISTISKGKPIIKLIIFQPSVASTYSYPSRRPESFPRERMPRE